MKSYKYLLLTSLVLLAACGADDAQETPVEVSFDVVKNISAKNQVLSDESTYAQDAFVISPDSRLIMSLGDLKDKADGIQIDDKHRVWAQISLTNPADRAQAMQSLQLCPLSRSWMMLSNWYRAHPYGKTGQWNHPGGDYIESLCQNGLPNLASDSATATLSQDILTQLDPSPQKIYFDVTDWFQNYVVGRSENFGLILLSDQALSVEGDRSPLLSPRIHWVEYRSPWTWDLNP